MRNDDIHAPQAAAGRPMAVPLRRLTLVPVLLFSGLALAQGNPFTSILRSVTNAVAPNAPAEPVKPGGNQTSVLGVRGLDEVAMKNAQPAYEAVDQMDTYAASADSAASAAKQAGLTARSVKYAGS